MRLTIATSPLLLAPPGSPVLQDRTGRCSVTFARVPAGVVEGRRHLQGHAAHSDRWTLYRARDQFADSADRDPLRFADPLMFVRMKQEFDHAYDQPCAPPASNAG